MSTPSTPSRRTRIPITQKELDRAVEALKDYASEDGLTPVRYHKGAKLTPPAILRATLGLTYRRSMAVMQKLKTTGTVIPTEHSTKVIIKSMMPALDASIETPQSGVVTVERIRQALRKLSDENMRQQLEIQRLTSENVALSESNAQLSAELTEVKKRVSALEIPGMAELNDLLEKIETAA